MWKIIRITLFSLKNKKQKIINNFNKRCADAA